jgi:DNA-binding MarR family transcriptional regulator
MVHTSKNIDILLGHITSLLTSKYDLILTQEIGISYSQYKILAQFTGSSIIRQKTIAMSLGQTEASISRQIGIMSANGLIHRTYDPDNKKSIVVTLTHTGKVIKERTGNLISNQNTNLLHKINTKTKKELLENLSKIHGQLCLNNHNY